MARVHAAARLGVRRGDHVTLARYGSRAELSAAALPAGLSVGQRVSFVAVAEALSDKLQAWVVEIGGSTRRPFDGGVLHVTVSRSEGARSKDANLLLSTGETAPLNVPLSGTVAWVER